MKTYLAIFTLCCVLFTGNVLAQCPSGDVTLLTQEEVNEFGALYPNCTEFEGYLTIGLDDDWYTPLTEISDLTPLNNIAIITRDLIIGGGYISTTLTGLSGLSSIGENLYFWNNHSLVSFSGLENLNSIGGNLYVDDCDSIVDFAGLESLSSIEGDLHVSGNSSLASFSGLENINSLGEFLYADYNESLTDFSGLENLNSIEGNLRIHNNYNLVSLSGLENLISIEGQLAVDDNIVLTDISGIENIDHTGITELFIRENSQLSLCGIENICDYLINGGVAFIENNTESCNNTDEIIQSCTSIWEYTVEGNIFMDANDNCLKDASELDLSAWVVKVEDEQSTRYAYTYANGRYITPVDTGTYTVRPIAPNSLWGNICPDQESITITSLNPRDSIDFAASLATLCPLLEIDITAPFVRRCFDSNYYVRYCNSGTAIAENAYVEVQLDPFFTYQNSTIAGIDLGENLYSFDLGNVNIGECGGFRIDVYVDCDSTEIGQTHCVEAHIYPDSICTPALPLWDESSIVVDAQCLGDSIEFKIENIGTGDMSNSSEYLIVEDDLIWKSDNFQLNSGSNIKIYKPANGEFHRLEAEQSPGHPGNSMPSVFVEGCGEGDNGEISIGFVNYYLLDEGDAFVSIDCQENVGSYDPNDKQAFPVGYGAPHYITDSTDLEYLIRFQNTGTDTAFNIVIRDTISPHLNMETLRPGVASHDYQYDIEESNIAVFHFENIMLPDSNVNEAASHGFIKFNIEQKQNNPIGTHIMNDAAIYFDFNEPIITNTVFHTIGKDFMGIVTSVITPSEVEEAGISVNVFPNPFDEYTRFEVQGEAVKELHLNVYDMMGREVFQQKAKHQHHITMKRNNLTPGVYVFHLRDEKQQLASGKLVIQ